MIVSSRNGTLHARPVRAARRSRLALPQAPEYVDFYALTQCDILAIPNSSFSFAAAMLNTRLRWAARSVLPYQTFVPFDPWNDKPLQQDATALAENYPHIPGVQR